MVADLTKLQSFGGGFRGFFKWAWHNYPHLVGAHFFSTIGLMMGGYCLYRYIVIEDRRVRYRDDFIVVRPGDPILNSVPLDGRYIPLDERKE